MAWEIGKWEFLSIKSKPLKIKDIELNFKFQIFPQKKPLPPFKTSHFTISGALTEAATCKGVRPIQSLWSISAPWDWRREANSTGQRRATWVMKC